jgi:large subunit ribosomal protein L24
VKNERVYVEGANIVKRHQRPTTLRDTQRGSQVSGGVIEKEGPIHISNVMLLDPKSGDPTRVRVSREGGQRKRIAARSGEPID